LRPSYRYHQAADGDLTGLTPLAGRLIQARLRIEGLHGAVPGAQSGDGQDDPLGLGVALVVGTLIGGYLPTNRIATVGNLGKKSW